MESISGRARVGLVLGAICLIAVTRISLAPKYLYYFDSVNFALSLDEFNPAKHQPQPPGYPLFVAFLRLVHLAAHKPEHALLAAGVLLAILSVFLIGKLGRQMFSAAVGWSAAVLLILNPAFWLAGISNQVRLCLAAGSIAVAMACWRSISRRETPWPFVLACVTLGVAGGFRPTMMVKLFPLLVFAGMAARRPLTHWLLGGAGFALAVAPWLGYTVSICGGVASFLNLLRTYAQDQFSASSLLMGATLDSAWTMTRAAFVWNGFGVLSWIWALAFLRPLSFKPDLRSWFLLAWFLPPFLFHSLIHVGDPDHTLVSITALCIAGGVVLASLGGRLNPPGWWIANGLALALNALLFFLPVKGLAGASTYRMVAEIGAATRTTFDAIRELSQDGPVAIVSNQSFITWRHLSYYFPQTPVLVLLQPYDAAIDPAQSWQMQKGDRKPLTLSNGEIAIPPVRRLIWVLPTNPAARAQLSRDVDLRQWGPVWFSDVEPGGRFSFGSYRFVRP